MRLDHLLSKENIVYFCFVTWVLVSTRLVTKFFCFRVKASAVHTSCVVCVVLGVDETKRGFFSWLAGWRGFAE